jgi:hypothetical protein
VDGDGDMDFLITNLDRETNAFYRNMGDSTFSDESFTSGVGEPSILFVGFGNNFLDFDSDGDLDSFIANGHILDNVDEYNETMSYAQTAHLLVNQGNGHFLEQGADHGEFFKTQGVARASATLDVENDGDVDLLVIYNNQPAKLLRNVGQGHGHWLQVKILGRQSNRDGIGTFMTLATAGGKQVREIRAGSSYLSQSSLVVHFGLGEETKIDSLTLRWPTGISQEFKGLKPDQLITVDEEFGILAK